MSLDEISVEYFSVLAERRRVALAEALEENEQLHREIDNLKLEVESLKAENEVLKPLAEETQYLAGVLKVQAFQHELVQGFKPVISFTKLTIKILMKYYVCPCIQDLMGSADDDAPVDANDTKEDETATQSESQ